MTGDFVVRLLGSVDVLRDQHSVSLGGSRQRRLLALLASECGRIVSVDRIVDELWIGVPPPNAEATLRTYMSRLRRTFGADVVVAKGRGYVLEIDSESIDVRRFERLLAEGRRALERGAAGAAADRLGAALDLWRGKAYGDVADTPSLTVDAQRLEELRLECIEQRIAAELDLGRHERVVPELMSLVAEYPLRERLWQHLIVGLYRSGRQGDALTAYQEARQRLENELGLDPGEELQRLERDVLRQEVATVVAPAARHNLPAPTTRLIGRDREVAEIETMLREHRLVVLTGIGGSGKTRLAIEVARRQLEAWPHGVWLVDLAAVSDPELVTTAVAGALSVAELTHSPLGSLIEHARTMELLVVLDNCEHLAAACARLAQAMLRECPDVRVLATSRVSLGVYGEVDYALQPLPAPPADADAEALRASPAVQLFCERAAALRRDFATDRDGFGVVAAICRELDGLPLAIELAAARTNVLSVGEVSARLDDRFRFLRAWHRVADARHATLQTTMDWSFGLLAETEQTLLRRLAVFSGGAPLDAVVDVCGDGDELHVVELLGRLVDASLLQVERGNVLRYRMLETVRQYAAAKLAGDAEEPTIRRRHAEHFLRLAEGAKLALDALGDGPQNAEIAVREQHNVRAALDWCATDDVELALRLMVALENFWATHAVHEAARRYDELLATPWGVDIRLRAQAERDRAALSDVLEQFPAARAGYLRSRALFEACADEDGVATLDFRLGLMALLQDQDVERAREMWEACLDTWRRLGNEAGQIQAITNLGLLRWRQGDTAGRAMVEEGVDRAEAIGWWWWAGLYSFRLADAAVGERDIARAERWGRKAVTMALRIDDRQTLLHGVAVVARAAALRGEGDRAADLWSAVESVEDAPGRFGRFDRDAYRAEIPPRPDRASLALDEAVALALR